MVEDIFTQEQKRKQLALNEIKRWKTIAAPYYLIIQINLKEKIVPLDCN